jgi:carbamoyl-phosphate synthase large subunit
MKERSLTVLVLGVGGNVSQGILKALALSQLNCRVIAACIDPLSSGLYTANRGYISPRADDPTFLDWLINLCCLERIDAILCGAELVLIALAPHVSDIYEQTGAICLVSSPECLAIGDDKLVTCQWLEQNGFNFPRYASAADSIALEKLVMECGFPLIAKPRLGKASNGVLQIERETQLALIAGQSKYIVQEYLGDATNEYTVGCFSDHSGQVRGTIAMRRELLAGTTYRAEVGDFPEVRAEARRIVEALRPVGPCNVQLRMSKGQPVCFEINVRFSGTTPMRARFGFNDVEAALRHFVLGEPAQDLPLITQGIAVRYWNELYLDPDAIEQLTRTQQLAEPGKHPAVVENYGMNL